MRYTDNGHSQLKPGRLSRLGEYGAASCVHTLDDEVVQHHLPLGSLHNVLLNTVPGNQTVDVHLGREGGRWSREGGREVVM